MNLWWNENITMHIIATTNVAVVPAQNIQGTTFSPDFNKTNFNYWLYLQLSNTTAIFLVVVVVLLLLPSSFVQWGGSSLLTEANWWNCFLIGYIYIYDVITVGFFFVTVSSCIALLLQNDCIYSNRLLGNMLTVSAGHGRLCLHPVFT